MSLGQTAPNGIVWSWSILFAFRTYTAGSPSHITRITLEYSRIKLLYIHRLFPFR